MASACGGYSAAAAAADAAYATNESCNGEEGYALACPGPSTGSSPSSPRRCVLCQRCRDGYSSQKHLCTACLSPHVQALVTGLASAGGVAVVLLLVFLRLKSAERGRFHRSATSTVKRIAITHVQILGLAFYFDIPFPRTITTM